MYKKVFFSIFFIFIATLLWGQKYKLIKGYVRDDDGPVIGATVWIIGTDKGTSTNANGYYELQWTEAKMPVLSFSYIGKKTVKVAYKGSEIFNVKMEDDLLMLDKVEIIAKPNINELDVRTKTGNIESVPLLRVKNTPVSSLAMALQGKTLGLQIINRGELGVLPQIRIRGTSSLRKGDLSNQPLYILDGKMISAETFFYLNPEDIREMKVLKDAVASALYGIKAANGVIEITSKRGGEKSLTYHLQSGITLVPPLRVKMMNSAEKLELERRLKNEATPGYLYSEDYIKKKYGGTPLEGEKLKEGKQVLDSLRNINTDWYRELTNIQSYQKHNLSYTDGDERTSYFVSLGYLHQGGQLEGNVLSRISSRVAIDKVITENAIGSLSINGSYGQVKTPNGGSFSPEQLIYQLNPYETKDSKFLYSYPRRGYADLFHQFSRESTSKNLGTSLSLNWKVNSALEISAVAGFDFSLSESLSIVPETAISETATGIPKNARGTLQQFKNTQTNITANLRANYSKTFGNHEITLGVNADNYTTVIDNLNVEGHGLYGKLHSAAAVDNSLTGVGRSIVGGQKQTERNIGFGFLAGYTFDKTYNLFGTYKLDASSVLPKVKRWNAAWALGGSINMKSYPFFEELSWLSSLDLRTSWGITANAQGISPSLITATFQYQPKSYGGVRVMEVLNLPNENLRAEQNEILDIGLAAQIRKSSFRISAYKRITKDALLSVPIASSSGFLYQIQNVGILENRGVEIGFGQQILSSDKWNVRVGGNLSYNENKVIDLYGKERLYLDESSILPEYEVGKSISAVYGLNSTGINPITGIPEYINHSGEQVDAYTRMKREDFIYLGESTPPVNGSLYFTIGYKKVQVAMDFYYSLGGVKGYSNTYIRDTDNVVFNASKSQIEDMWWQVGDENKKYPDPFLSTQIRDNINKPSNKTTLRADFLRFSSLSINYQVDTQNTDSLLRKIRYMTLGVEASNLFMLSGFRESNPETSNIINPLPPTITFNLNITF